MAQLHALSAQVLYPTSRQPAMAQPETPRHSRSCSRDESSIDSVNNITASRNLDRALLSQLRTVLRSRRLSYTTACGSPLTCSRLPLKLVSAGTTPSTRRDVASGSEEGRITWRETLVPWFLVPGDSQSDKDVDEKRSSSSGP